MGIAFDPVFKKRVRRFARNRRAFVSFILLVFIFLGSLPAEFFCNDRPLVVRCEGRWYFPVLFYYPEDTFLHNGKKTRPDYRELAKKDLFCKSRQNFMIFPLHPYSPYESISPESIEIEDKVEIRIRPEPISGYIETGPDLVVIKQRNLSMLLGDSKASRHVNLRRIFDLSPSFIRAMEKRYANLESESVEQSIVLNNKTLLLRLPAYRPRAQPPSRLRILFFEDIKGEKTTNLVLLPGKKQPETFPPVWEKILPDQRSLILSLAQERFNRPVESIRVKGKDRAYRITFEKAEVMFPYPPVKDHPLGLDAAGRDVLARLYYGFRISLIFGLLLSGCAVFFGVIAGGLQGYYGGKVDIISQRLIEIWNALPFLYVMILMGSVYGRSFWLLLFCYGLFNWIGISYYVRAEFLKLRSQPFVDAARCLGLSDARIIFSHIMPNALVPVITFFPFSLVGAIGSLAALDYLGFGLPPPTPSWGEMLFEAQQFRWAWWLILYPSLALFLVMLLGVFIGEGIRDAYDPKAYGRYH